MNEEMACKGWKEPPPDDLSKINFQGELLAARGVGEGPKYKARPLDGIWATAPYLHNGSVPNLDELLRPAAQRSKSFTIGTRTFDSARVGFATDAPGFPQFRVVDAQGRPIPGNSNAGHEGLYYTQIRENNADRDFTDTERRAIIEYLKTLH